MPFPFQLAMQGLRFVAIGGATTALQLSLVWLATPRFGSVPTFVASWALCTLLSTLGHRAFTFRRGERARFDQIVGYATALASLTMNTTLMSILQPHDGRTGALIVFTVNLAIGIARFVILRTWFLGNRRRPKTQLPLTEGT